MLSTFRTKIKFWSNIALWPVIIAFIAFYGWSFSGSQQKDIQGAAMIGDTTISFAQVANTRQQLIQYYRSMYKDNFAQYTQNIDFEEQALDQLISQEILRMAGSELGVTVTKDEVEAKILSLPYFQKDGQFSPSLYNRALQSLRMSAKEYEASLAGDILLQKVRTLIGAAAPITTDELKDTFESQNVKINCETMAFNDSQYLDQVTVTDADARKYFDSHTEDYRVGDQIRVDYLMFDPTALEAQVNPTEEEIDDYYLENIDKYTTEEQIRASHILLKISEDASEEFEAEVTKKMQDLKQRIDNGESFEDLAKEFSEDSSAANGGDLGFFGRNRMVKPFETAAWDLEMDAVSEPVRSRFGYHLIKKTGYKKGGIQPVEEVRGAVIRILKTESAKAMALDKAQEIYDAADSQATLQDIATQNNLEIHTTDFFEIKSPPQELGRSRELTNILTDLGEYNFSIPVQTFKGSFILAKNSEKESYIPEFEDVKDRVETDTKRDKAQAMARADAEKVLAALKQGSPWSKVAEEYELTPTETGEFTQAGYIPRVGSVPDEVEKLFSLNIGDISEIIEVRGRFFILKVIDYKKYDQAEFEKSLPKLRQQIAMSRQQQAVASWVQQKRTQLERDGSLIVKRPG